MKRIFSVLIAFAICSSVSFAQYHQDKFKNYTDCSIPHPEGSTKITKKDLQLTDKYIDLYPNGVVYFSQSELRDLYTFYKTSPEGKEEWSSIQAATIKLISSWDLSKAGGFPRYIYKFPSLRKLALAYIFTGNPLISRFIRAHLANAAALPMEFWLHSELRGYDKKCPSGTLETTMMNETLPLVIPAVKKDMTVEELADIENVWFERGHKTALNWIKHKKRMNNFLAVISNGSLFSSKYFQDEEGKQVAMDGIRLYINNCIHTDGSYDEGPSYFAYPVGNLFSGCIALSQEDIDSLYNGCNLKNSSRWRVYGMLFDKEGEKPGVMRISYGDNCYGGRSLKGVDKVSAFSTIVFRDGVAQWLTDKFGTREDSEAYILRKRMNSVGLPAKSPAEAGLPLAKAFENGDCFIRSSWDDMSTVLALKAGDDGSQCVYSHNRPELQSIALGAFGEYIIVTTGSASYRGALHYEYDRLTRSANTITIDGMNQKYPGTATYKEGKWDNRQYWVEGKPHVYVRKCETLPDGGAILKTEAEDLYHIEMKEATRTIRYVQDGGFFIMVDRMSPADGQSHTYDYRFHLFNRDGKTFVQGNANRLTVQRGAADLHIAMYSNAKLKFSKGDGYMHGPTRRDYSPDGPNQGKPGSAIELDWQAGAADFSVTAVLYPVPAGARAPKIKISDTSVIVNGKAYEIPE